MAGTLKIVGAREHNLRNLSLRIPKERLVILTGLSGSGKSSLAFDTVYAEGQRRYVESLSAYARQFLELMDKPDVDLIEGLSPAIAIEQRSPSRNPRSTVATVTEIYDYLRLLFARVGIPHCPRCGREVVRQSPQAIQREVLKAFSGRSVSIFSPLVRGRIGTYAELFARLRRLGYAKVRIDGKLHELEDPPKLTRYKKHTIDLLVDRLKADAGERERLADSLELALKESRGLVQIVANDSRNGAGVVFSEHHACADCGLSLPELEPRLFSFNSPYGACGGCGGLGFKTEVAQDLVVPDPSLSIAEGAVAAWSDPVTTRTNRWKRSWAGYYEEILRDVCRRLKIRVRTPWKDLPAEARKAVLHGGGFYKGWSGKDKDYEGVIGNLERRHRESESEFVKEEIYRRFMREAVCEACGGARLKEEALAVRLAGLNIVELTRRSVREAAAFFDSLRLSGARRTIAKQVLKEIHSRLRFLLDVGLDYLTLDRRSETLAGGEAQRIHLATQIGSGLTGVLYVLDEPTIGLHPRDNERLLATLRRLRGLGNTLLVVEHDEETIRAADWIVDLGPGAGVHGGAIVAQGPLKKILASRRSLTGRYLRGDLKIPVPAAPRRPTGPRLEVLGASQFNLKDIDVRIPLGRLVCLTGVSGSGKSTFVHEVLYKALAKRLLRAKAEPGAHRGLRGAERIDKVVVVDQAPIGRTPRSNPATYTGAFSHIRELFARLPESRKRGYKPGRFSFNVKGGRCENCRGDGTLRIQMQFLPDVYVKCEECEGRRFNEETLQVRYKGKSVAEVLELPIEEALEFFGAITPLKRILGTLRDVGLGYVKLGQSATTLSGGEAQRVKLASELQRRAAGGTLYLLDEPTTGLHFADVHKLLEVLQRLVEGGSTVLVIEHNLDVVKTADWIIDLGPEGGDRGGRIVAEGPPKEIAACRASHTGRWLKPLLERR